MKFAILFIAFFAMVAVAQSLSCYSCNGVEECKNLTDANIVQCAKDQHYCAVYKGKAEDFDDMTVF